MRGEHLIDRGLPEVPRLDETRSREILAEERAELRRHEIWQRRGEPLLRPADHFGREVALGESHLQVAALAAVHFEAHGERGGEFREAMIEIGRASCRERV